MIITGCETCTKDWEKCCGVDCTPEELERIEKQVEEFYASKSGGMVDTHG